MSEKKAYINKEMARLQHNMGALFLLFLKCVKINLNHILWIIEEA